MTEGSESAGTTPESMETEVMFQGLKGSEGEKPGSEVEDIINWLFIVEYSSRNGTNKITPFCDQLFTYFCDQLLRNVINLLVL